MSGHSKWATIKHKKAAIDAKRGKVFSKISKEITLAAKQGGGDPIMNPRLRTAILAGKAVNMPADNVDRAIKKGTGELPGVVYEEVMYEAYGPAGVGILIQIVTDNRNRAASEVRSTLERRGAKMANAGAVSYQFQKKGLIAVDKTVKDEDAVFMTVTEAGAEDLKTLADTYEIITPVEVFDEVKKALEAAGIKTASAELTMLPASTIKVTGEKDASSLLKLLESIEDLDDVQNVYSNFDMDEELMQKVSAE